MADPKIKYDIEADVKGNAEVESLAKTLEELGGTLGGSVKQGAEVAAESLRELANKSQAGQTFRELKRDAVDLEIALKKAAISVDDVAERMPAAAAATQRFAEAERGARTAVDDAQQGIKSMQQALRDLRTGNEAAARGTDEYKASVAQARSTIAELRVSLVQKKTDLKEAEAATRSATVAEAKLADEYKLSANAAAALSASSREKNTALDAARTAAQALGVDTSKLRQEEQALAAGMDAAKAKIKELVDQQNAAAVASRAQAEAMAKAKLEADAAATAAAAAGQRIQNAFSTLGARSASELRAEIAQVRAALQTVEAESGLTGNALKQAMGAGNVKLRELQRELKGVQGELTLADRAAGALRTGLGRIAAGNVIANALGNITGRAAQMGREFLQANLQMEGLRRALNAVYKDANVTASQIDFLRKTASDAGVSAGGLSDSFKSFAAATQAANIPLQTTNELFAGVTKAGATLGLSGERVSLVLQALGQMASKGVVSMEELRQQLGESLPGALTLAAKGLGLTEAQLIKLVETGGLASRDLFPALARSLKQLQGETEGVTASWERFKNALTITSQNAGDAGGMQLLTLAIKALGAVTGAVIVPLSILYEVGMGVAKMVGVLAASVITLSNPLEALGEIFSSAGKRIEQLRDAFSSVSKGANATVQAQSEVGAAIAQTGASASAATAGIGQLGLAHGAAAGAAQANTAAQAASAAATTIAGNASLDAGAKWVQLGVQLRDIAAAQEAQAKNTEKLAAAAKIEGDSLVALAALRGNELESLQAASHAAEEHSLALQKVAAAREAHLATLRAELEAKNALIAGNAAEQKAREVELKEIQKKIDALTAEATASRAAAEASKTEAAVRRAAVGVYQDNARAVGELRLAMDIALRVQKELEEAERRGLATKQLVADATRRAAEAQRLYNDALDDVVAAEQRRGAATSSRLQLERAGLDLAMAQAKAAELKAIADGNEYAATQARIKQKEIEIATVKLSVATLITEADAMDLVTNKKIEAAIAQGKWTEAMGAEMQLLRDSAALKRIQAAATKESIEQLERERKALKDGTADHKDNTAARQSNTEAMSKQTEAMDRLMMKYTLSADYTERQLALLEKENALIERREALEDKRLNRDKEGFSIDPKTGQRVNMHIDSQRSVYENAKGQGLTEQQALEIMARFMTENGEKSGAPGRSSQLKGENWGTALQKAINEQVIANATAVAQESAPQLSGQGAPQPMGPQSARTVNVDLRTNNGTETVPTTEDGLQALLRALQTARGTSSSR